MIDNQEFERLYTEFYPKVYRYISGHMNDKNEAENLAQTVFVKVYTKADLFDEKKSSISTWIYNIARNTVIDHQRAMAFRRHEELPDVLEDDSGGILDGLIEEETLDKLADALEQLTEEERSLIILHYYSNYTMIKIAEMMHRPYGQIKRLHTKALQKMKLYMGTDLMIG